MCPNDLARWQNDKKRVKEANLNAPDVFLFMRHYGALYIYSKMTSFDTKVQHPLCNILRGDGIN